MKVFDDKSKGIAKCEKYMVLQSVEEAQDVTFKSSYIVVGNVTCEGKITALFDFVVFGDVSATDVEVKGRFVCLGECRIVGQLVVQNDIWVDEIEATKIVSRDRVVAQNIDVCELMTEGSVIIGKTLSIEKIAEIGDILLCGETAYGSGHVAASTVITVEPLDLDDGEEAIVEPNTYNPVSKSSGNYSALDIVKSKYFQSEDYEGYIADLLQLDLKDEEKNKLNIWLEWLYRLEKEAANNFEECSDAILLINCYQMIQSSYFSEWGLLLDWKSKMLERFEKMLAGTEKKYQLVPCNSMKIGDEVQHLKYGRGRVVNDYSDWMSKYVEIKFANMDSTKKFTIPDAYKFFKKIVEIQVEKTEKYEKLDCVVNGYQEWLNSLMIINKFHNDMSDTIYSALFDRLMAYVGLKSKYMIDRFKEKGWQ